MKGNCWLIGDSNCRFSVLVAQTASLRGLALNFCPLAAEAIPALPAARFNLIALSFDRLKRLSPREKAQLKTCVGNGATLYIRGGALPGEPQSLWPFADHSFTVEVGPATAYRFSRHPLVPDALHGEEVAGDFITPIGMGLEEVCESICLARFADGGEWPTLFLMRCGAGHVIYDLHSDEPALESSMLAMFEDPKSLCVSAGALFAADLAAGLDWQETALFNLVIDDRPANFDFLTTTRLQAFLQHLEDRVPGIHVDFAWTPDQTHPSHRYMDVLKAHNTGFVWHGFLHHVDHRTVSDPRAELSAGRRLVEDISRRYGVRFQPVMVFPFEKDTPEDVDLLKREGFLAKTEIPGAPGEEHLRSSPLRPWNGHPQTNSAGFTVLPRYPVEALTYNRMLACALLSLPIIAAAHPADIALRRLAPLRPTGNGSLSHFDRVLDFAARKHLRPGSLEQMAEQMITSAV